MELADRADRAYGTAFEIRAGISLFFFSRSRSRLIDSLDSSFLLELLSRQHNSIETRQDKIRTEYGYDTKKPSVYACFQVDCS
jgi:hypothetical protein